MSAQTHRSGGGSVRATRSGDLVDSSVYPSGGLALLALCERFQQPVTAIMAEYTLVSDSTSVIDGNHVQETHIKSTRVE